jgi:tetratricopeptide (TPR) repeat protein
MLIVVLFIVIAVIGVILVYFVQSSQSRKRIDRAIELFKTERYREALALFQELYAKDSGNKLYNWYIGQCYEYLNNHELALVEYNKASLSTTFDPPLDEVKIHKRIAMVNLELGNMNKAYQEFQIVTTLDTKNAEAYFYLGTLAKNKGELQKGVEYFEKAYRNRREYPEAYLEHGKLNLMLNHTEKAKRSFLQAITQNPDLNESHFQYAVVLEKDKVYQKSIDEFQLALRDERFKFDSLVHLANIHMALSESEAAFNYFEEALAEGTADSNSLLEAKYEYANHLIQYGDINKALTLWNAIYSQDANFRDVENKIHVYSEISKSENLTRLMTSNTDEFLKIGQQLCALLHIKIDHYKITKNDLIEFSGNQRSGRDDIACVLYFVKWTAQVGELQVRELLEKVVDEGALKGIFVTPTHFSDKALNLAKIRPLELIERERLEGLLTKIFQQ